MVGQFLTGVLLQEVSGAAQHRVIDTLRAAHLALEDRTHGPVNGSLSLKATSMGVD